MSVGINQSDAQYENVNSVVSVHYNFYYVGLILSCVLTCAKKTQGIFFSTAMACGAVALLIEFSLGANMNTSAILIHFAGGYFEGITPTYCIFSLFILKNSIRGFSERNFCDRRHNRLSRCILL